MSRHQLSVVLLVVVLLGSGSGPCMAEPKTSTLQNHRELARLLNIVKKAPQRESRTQARTELEAMGVSNLQIVYALTLDQWLLESDPIVRHRASAELGQMQSPLRVLAVMNLRNLIAAESDPNLIWMHAVTLSSIDPQSGSTLDLLAKIPADPILRATLNLDKSHPVQVSRSDNERAIYEIPLRKAEYRELTRLLRLAHLGNPADSQFIATYASPAPTIIEINPAAVAEKNPANSQFIETYASPALTRTQVNPPAVAEKNPAHPLIVGRRFEEILEKMEQGSVEAWELFRLHGAEFPPAPIVKKYVPRAFETDWRLRERAMYVLSHAGPDAATAAALIHALGNDSAIPDHLEIIERIKSPGPYSQEVLKRIRFHKNPSVRKAVCEAFSRAPGMEKILLETLRFSLGDNDPDIRHNALGVIAQLREPDTQTQTWLKELLLKEEHSPILSAAASGLKGVPLPADFQQSVFERIDPKQSAETNLIFIGCLLDHADPQSAVATELRKLQEAMQSLYVLQMARELENDLRWMIQQAETIKLKSEQEGIKQLKTLLIIVDE